jgi:DNA-binding transcriptional regulator YdaS (Cro superfamily)
MSLKKYLKSLTQAEREALAVACDTSLGQLNQVAWGYRRAGETLAINIDRESGGKVTCEELRPDVDWAYLRNTKPKKSKAA